MYPQTQQLSVINDYDYFNPDGSVWAFWEEDSMPGLEQLQQLQGLGGLGFDPGSIVAIGSSLFQGIKNIFGKKVTPEDQAKKAGVWGAMLADFLSNPNMTGYNLGLAWKSLIPFAQRSTRDRFVRNNLNGKSREYIIDHLVVKINDELRKGGLQTYTKKELLSNYSKGQVIDENDIVPQTPSRYPTQSRYPAYPRYGDNTPVPSTNPPNVSRIDPNQYNRQAGFGIDSQTLLIGGGLLIAGLVAANALKDKN